MSNIIFLSSVIAAIIWALCYLLISAVPGIDFILIAAFVGIIISVVMDEKKQISKQ